MAFCCQIKNCQVRFNEQNLLDLHMQSDKHSPCQIYKFEVNAKVTTPDMYACAICQPPELFTVSFLPVKLIRLMSCSITFSYKF
jgi:hypothetical protein